MFLVSQFYFLQSPLFQFNDVQIEGADSLSESDIESTLGLVDTTSFWDVSNASLQQNLMVMHKLREAQVEMSFPGRVSVTVNERKPAYYAAFIGNTKAWCSVDSDGIVLDKADANSQHLRILLAHPVRPGGQVRKSDLKVIRFFEDNLTGKLREQVMAIKLGVTGEVAFRMKYGGKPIWVRLGRPEKLSYKLFLLQQMMTKLTKDKSSISSIDLRYSAPVVKKADVKAD
jgi:cell division septal protein FtsQ